MDDSYNKQVISGTSLADCTYTGVSVALASKVLVRISVTCKDLSKYTYKVVINGREYTYTGADLVEVNAGKGDGKYYLYFDQVRATEMNDVITFTIWDGDTQVSRTVQYSVFTYVQKQCENTEQTETYRNLMKALFNYGVSTKNA